jgi:hypothetical protein
MTNNKEEKKRLFCPYCDEEIMRSDFPYCQPCEITIFYCPKCCKPLPRNNRICPECGAEIKG